VGLLTRIFLLVFWWGSAGQKRVKSGLKAQVKKKGLSTTHPLHPQSWGAHRQHLATGQNVEDNKYGTGAIRAI
jgi:hypothetical protein